MATSSASESLETHTGLAEERYYTTNLNSRYVLPSDQVERKRLQLQHDILKPIFGGQALVESLYLLNGDKVLDAGAGSGLWVLEMVSVVPSGVTIIGCDIESRLFPANAPANTSFCVQSVLSLPSEWSPQFALSHQRFMIAALGLSDWQRALSEHLRILKPGGWIRVEESGNLRLTSDTGDAGFATLPHTQRHVRILENLFRARNLLLYCGARLPELISEAGFEDMEQESTLIPLGPGEIGERERENWLGAFGSMKTPVLKMGGFGIISSELEWDNHMRSMETEWANNNLALEVYAFTARKPMSAVAGSH